MLKLVDNLILLACLFSLIALPKEIIARSSLNSKIDSRNGLNTVKIFNECGGYIENKLDQVIILEYKLDEEYENDELCVWEVINDDCNAALFTKTKSGFEVDHDFLQVSAFSNTANLPATYILGNTTGIEQINGRGPIIYLIFSSDYSNTGTGFRLEVAGYETRTSHRVYTPFITDRPFGGATLRPYVNDMTQSYVILPKRKTVSSLTLDVEYKTLLYDYISVYSMERNGGYINFKQHAQRLRENGSDTFEAVYHSNFVVLFYSDRADVATNGGFTLNWYAPPFGTNESY